MSLAASEQQGEATEAVLRGRRFRKSTGKLSENPSPRRPNATRAVFEEI
jgi:hypothetical protein